jgi:hypothetical protein
LISCEPKKRDNVEVDSIKIMQVSKQSISEKIYSEVYGRANDSVTSWIAHSLQSYLYERDNNWRIDSLLCFNTQKDKAIMALLNQDRYPTSKNDGINVFYGVKIKEKWYFFKGPFIVLIRENYQKDIHTPLPFTKLHEIAMDNIFKGYLKKNKQSGEWEINEGFFARFYERDAYNFPFTTQEAWEESWLRLMHENWKNRDTAHYQPLQ